MTAIKRPVRVGLVDTADGVRMAILDTENSCVPLATIAAEINGGAIRYLVRGETYPGLESSQLQQAKQTIATMRVALEPFALHNLYPPDPVEKFDEETPIYVHLPSHKKSVPVATLHIGDVRRARAALALGQPNEAPPKPDSDGAAK